MSNSATKLALLPLVLATTWATAEADAFNVTVTPTENLDHLYLFEEEHSWSIFAPSVTSGQAITGDLGTLTAGQSYSTAVSTSYGTSSAWFFAGNELEIGALAVTESGDLALSGTATSPLNYTTMFGSTGVSQADALTAATAGGLTTASSLYPAGSANGLYGTLDNPTGSVNLYAFDSVGAARLIGTASVQAVPEPASMAALGLGAIALIRRRRK